MHHHRSTSSSARTPAHVAIIMDGNGRWAQSRGLPRFEGHRRGVEAVRRVVRSAIERGVQFLTIYSFSSENWSRPPDEVAMLMGLLKRFIRNDLAELNANGVKVRIIGERDNLTPDIVALLVEAETLTANNRGLTLTVAFNYGGRQEIVEAARRLGDRHSRRAPRRAGDRRGRIGRAARYGRPSRSRSHHPHFRRNAAVEFPALAGGLRRIRLPSDPVARFRRRGLPLRARSVCGARTAVRRGRRARRRQIGVVRTCAMAVSGEGPAIGSAPRRPRSAPTSGRAWRRLSRWGASRWRRRGSAASSSRFSGGWRRLSSCGSGSGWSAARASPSGWRSAALMVALAALFALHNSILGAIAALALGAAAVGWLAGRRGGAWAAAGALYAGALVASVVLLEDQSELRPGRDFVALRGRLGSGYRGLFRRPADRRPAALAERLARQDLVRRDRRRARRGRPRPHARGVDESARGAVLARACDGDRVRAWRSVRIRAQAAVRRQGFERPHSWPRRTDGPARRFRGGVGLRRRRGELQTLGVHSSAADCFNGERCCWRSSFVHRVRARPPAAPSACRFWARRVRSDARARKSSPPRPAGSRLFRSRAGATARRWRNARSSSAPNSPPLADPAGYRRPEGRPGGLRDRSRRRPGGGRGSRAARGRSGGFGDRRRGGTAADLRRGRGRAHGRARQQGDAGLRRRRGDGDGAARGLDGVCRWTPSTTPCFRRSGRAIRAPSRR